MVQTYSRSNRLKLNTISSIILQFATIICGFIVPRLILGTYGSEINGLVNSISQFLSMISFMEMGVGAVVQSSLYKPLADSNSFMVSSIVKSAERFFRTIAFALVGYTLLLSIILPRFVKDRFGFFFTVILIVSISCNSFFQYFIGMPERLLLMSDQKGFITYLSQTITLVANTAISAALIVMGARIQTVKMVSAFVFLIRPIFLRLYVNCHYCIDRKISYIDEPIGQKWNGIAQHIAAVVLDQADVVILTLFSTLSNVSVYSVYHLIVFGIKRLFLSALGGVQPLMGEYIAKDEKDKLASLFEWTEWLVHTGTTLLFTCAGILIVPFVRVYTNGINDANYVVPVFAALITIANAGHCLRLPYNIMILAAGHYKQTQYNYIIAALLNVVISILAVHRWGLTGVAVGTVVAMIYQTIWMAYYDSKNILDFSIGEFWKHCLVDGIIALCTVASVGFLGLKEVSYSALLVLAVIKGMICFAISAIVNTIFYRNMVKRLLMYNGNCE